MAIRILPSVRGYKGEYLKADLMAGLVIAALSIPISMGYASVAGLPPVYGLYGSIVPTIVYSLFASSPQVLFGVDAAAAAITGSVLATAGIAAGSQDAILFVPLLALLSGLMLVVFSFARIGKLMSFVSQPVMGGFISGVGFSLMAMQIPKMMGLPITPSEEIITNVILIVQNAWQVNWIAVGLAAASIAVILFARRFYPKVPMPLFVLIMSIFVMMSGELENRGVKVMGTVQSGLPALHLPLVAPDQLAVIGGYGNLFYYAFLVAVVIMTESLLASNSFSLKNDYKLDDNQELLAFGLANAASSFVGSTPTSASVSRTAASDNFGGKTQLAPIISAVIMIGVLFLTPLLYHLPMPVLSAIVFCALTTVVEWDLAKHLRKKRRNEYLIFLASCLGVLFFGIIPGVIIGVVLSFFAMLRLAAGPPRSLIGTMEGQRGYFALTRFPEAKSIPGVVMYRFSAALSFANARVFCNDVEDAFGPDIRLVIIDASGIGAIDFTAVDRLDKLARKIEATGARLYFANQIPSVNDELKRMGLERITQKPGKSREIEDVLAEFGIEPYPGVAADDFKMMKAQLHCSFLKDTDACDFIVRRHMKSGTPGAQPMMPGTAASGTRPDAADAPRAVASVDGRPHSGPAGGDAPAAKAGMRPHSGPDEGVLSAISVPCEGAMSEEPALDEMAMPEGLTPEEIIDWKIENLSYELPEDDKADAADEPPAYRGQPYGPDR